MRGRLVTWALPAVLTAGTGLQAASLLLAAAPVESQPLAAGAAVTVRTPTLSVTVGAIVKLRPGHGRLDVAVAPERAKVYVDGRYLGRGDRSLVVVAGAHRVKVVLGNGREVEAKTVQVEAGHVTHVHLDLRD